MAGRTPHSAFRTPHSKRLVPLLLDWFAANARDLPWRRTSDPYAIWVSEIMLQQTQVATVLPYWERWMRELPTIESVANASPNKIHKLWEGLGYYTRARNLQKAAREMMEKHGGKFPRDFDSVLALPGIGRYTAGAICSIAFDQPTPILDGNVIRVLTRIFGIAGDPKEKETNARLWDISCELAGRALRCPPRRGKEAAPRPNSCSHLNQSLMELGALVCTPRNPRCPVCPVKGLCIAFREKRTGDLPNLGKRTATTARHFVAFVVERNGKFLVRQRPAGVVNAHLWEFPNVEFNGAHSGPAQLFKSEFGFAPAELSPLAKFKHSITRYRITLQSFATSVKNPPFQTIGTWKTPGQMRRLAFSAAHKKLATLAANRILPDP